MISAVLVSIVIGIVFWVWYPSPSFEVVGASSIIRLLVGVDLVLGPLLTLIVYKHGKPGLKFDLAVIALLQIVALVYGSYRLYDEKPRYMVFAVDRIEFIAEKQIDTSAIRYDELRGKEFAKLIPVFARLPEDPEEYQRYFDSVLFEGKPDLESRPEYWEPWANGADIIRRRIKRLEEMKPASADEQEVLQRAIDKFSAAHPKLGILPIGGVQKDMGMLLDVDTLDVLGVIYANPWLQEGT